MQLNQDDLVLITGATGLVGSHVAERLSKLAIPTRALVRASSDITLLNQWGVQTVIGDMADADSLTQSVQKVTVIIHCAAKVGDWGPIEEYRQVNVVALETFLNAGRANGHLKRFVHVSSMGVYPARDHYGTDESEPPNATGIDGYTRTKMEAEQLVSKYIKEHNLPAVILRPGFIYGPRDRTVVPRILERLKNRQVKFLGTGEQLCNNTYVGNLVDAIFLTIDHDDVIGEIFNIRDGRSVNKREFLNSIAQLAGYPLPVKSVPIPVAKAAANVMEGLWKLLGMKEAPFVSSATIKFLGYNLDYSINKAQRQLGYNPQVDFQDGMTKTINWFREQGVV